MITVDYELGKKIVETCICDCGAALTLPWGGNYGIDSFVIRCRRDPNHDKVKPLTSFYQIWRDGEALPPFIKNNIERKLRREIMEEQKVKALVIKKDAEKLSTYLKAKFPQDLAKEGAALEFAKWCIAHGLEPIRHCIPYQGNPYITVRWLDEQAAADDKFRGIKYRVMSKDEKEALDFNPRDLVCEALGYWEGLDADKPLSGLGVVLLDEREAMTERGTHKSPVVASHAQQMMFKRGRVTVYSQRYHPPAPILEELPYVTIINAESRVITEETKKIGAAKPTEPEEIAEDRKRIESSIKRLGWNEAKAAAYFQDRTKDKSVTTVDGIPADKVHKIAMELADWEQMA